LILLLVVSVSNILILINDLLFSWILRLSTTLNNHCVQNLIRNQFLLDLVELSSLFTSRFFQLLVLNFGDFMEA
jgi:hypothetical protein